MLVIVLGGVASLVLVAVGLLALERRRSRSYLLVVAALGTLLAKAAIGGLTLLSVFPRTLHHPLEHALDLVMASLLLAAVYFARRPTDRTPPKESDTKPASSASLTEQAVGEPVE
jgi:heme A synthase